MQPMCGGSDHQGPPSHTASVPVILSPASLGSAATRAPGPRGGLVSGRWRALSGIRNLDSTVVGTARPLTGAKARAGCAPHHREAVAVGPGVQEGPGDELPSEPGEAEQQRGDSRSSQSQVGARTDLQQDLRPGRDAARTELLGCSRMGLWEWGCMAGAWSAASCSPRWLGSCACVHGCVRPLCICAWMCMRARAHLWVPV